MHSEMLMEFITQKIKLKVVFRLIYDLRVKNKERSKLIRFEDGINIKDKILSVSRKKEKS